MRPAGIGGGRIRVVFQHRDTPGVDDRFPILEFAMEWVPQREDRITFADGTIGHVENVNWVLAPHGYDRVIVTWY